MAKVGSKSTLQGVTGRVGDLILRDQLGETVVQLRSKEKEDNPSPAQSARRLVFRQAQNYARDVLSDPLKRKWYQRLGAERNRPPNTLLVSNFMTPPVIDEIELAGYHGSPGDEIGIIATDAIEVVDVTVAIRDGAGTVLEQAQAKKDHGIWIHRTTAVLALGQAVTITVTARNRAGRSATESRDYP